GSRHRFRNTRSVLSFSLTTKGQGAGSAGDLAICPLSQRFGIENMSLDGLYDALMDRLEKRTAKVCVIGLGYVGLPLADTFASRGYRVIGFDVDPEKVRKLKAGQSYIGHIPSQRIADLIQGGRFDAT